MTKVNIFAFAIAIKYVQLFFGSYCHASMQEFVKNDDGIID
jgi:hypothetical protein